MGAPFPELLKQGQNYFTFVFPAPEGQVAWDAATYDCDEPPAMLPAKRFATSINMLRKAMNKQKEV
jgi:hypothetical protein